MKYEYFCQMSFIAIAIPKYNVRRISTVEGLSSQYLEMCMKILTDFLKADCGVFDICKASFIKS